MKYRQEYNDNTLTDGKDDRRSRMRAIAVVHEGKPVYENYIGIRPLG